jgi:hypothetical protein
MAPAWYNTGKGIILDPSGFSLGETPLQLLLDRIVPGLMRAAYVPDIDLHINWDDTGVSTNSIVATNYVQPGAGTGVELGTKATAVNTTTDLAWFDAADTVYTGIGNGTNDTFDTVIITREQDAGATAANTFLIGYADGLSATQTNGGNITLVWDTAGILQIT